MKLQTAKPDNTANIIKETLGGNEMNETTIQATIEKRAYTVPEIMEILQIGRNNAYELCNSDTFDVKRIGKLIRIPKTSFDRWLDSNEQ